MGFKADRELTDHALDLCQRLLRIDTTNPPGNEIAAARLIADELAAAGLEPVVLESAPGRGNVVARLKGTGAKAPLLLTAHLDVVEATGSRWTHPPFDGVIADGFLWGRGAIDMKNMAAMAVALVCRLARAGVTLDRDLIFAGVADEEAGCEQGSMWLAHKHPDLVRAEYAIGEGGGFNIRLAGSNVFTVQVAEKGFCWVRARVKGEPGHGSMPRPDSAVVRLSEAVARLGRRGLPMRSTPVVRDFLDGLGKQLPGPLGGALRRLLESPLVAPRLLKLLPDQSVARGLRSMLGNTASPTVLRAGGKANVIPPVAEAIIDGRTLPGQTDQDFLAELQAVMGDDVELTIVRSQPPTVTEPRESEVLDAIMAVMAQREPDSPVIPYLLPGFTDAKGFTLLGARWYGFAPVKLPPGVKFADMFHGDDERIPIDGLRWGTEVLTEIVTRVAGVR